MNTYCILFPVLLSAPALLVWALTTSGWSPPLALTVAVLGLIAALTLLERRWPFRREWAEPAGSETATDVVYIALASVPDRLTRIAVEATALGLLGWSVVAAPSRSVAHSVLAAAAAFLVADLGKYLLHRASHSVPWLWRFHLAHHQPARLSAMNALRLHPVNMALNAAIDTVPLLVFGVSPSAAAVLAAVRATVGVVQHANLDLEDGRQWLVNAPSYHRVHHHVEVDEANHNFASTLLLWDRLFGTFRRAPAPPSVGVAPTQHRLPVGYVGQLVYPWCGDRLDTTCLLARYPWMVR
jgi:sterol desaturase/sphingolipid hydroxylase (fatty acid hydroxylase superfamily)